MSLNFMLVLFLNINSMMLHDFHVSICEIEYDQKRKALEISQRIFLDDLEETLRNWSGDNKIDVTNPKDEKQFQKILGRYLLENIAIKVNGKTQELVYLGSEVEDDVIYSYLEITGVKKLNSIEVKNASLTDIYSDQTNIVHVIVNRETRSMKLDKEHVVGEIYY